MAEEKTEKTGKLRTAAEIAASGELAEKKKSAGHAVILESPRSKKKAKGAKAKAKEALEKRRPKVYYCMLKEVGEDKYVRLSTNFFAIHPSGEAMWLERCRVLEHDVEKVPRPVARRARVQILNMQKNQDYLEKSCEKIINDVQRTVKRQAREAKQRKVQTMREKYKAKTTDG